MRDDLLVHHITSHHITLPDPGCASFDNYPEWSRFIFNVIARIATTQGCPPDSSMEDVAWLNHNDAMFSFRFHAVFLTFDK